jgi:putative oxidoreductase
LNGLHSIESWEPRALAVLRIVVGYLFLQHGSAKLLGFPHVATFDHVAIMSMIGVAGILELVGGALILVGLFVRPVAFVLSGEMAVAYFVGHAPHGNFLFPTLNQGEAAVLYCFVFLFLAVAGAGVWSIDAVRRGRAVDPLLSNRNATP